MSQRKMEFTRGEQVAGKYEVVDLLDESPLGLTYRVKHIKSGKYVRLLLLRLKVSTPEQRDELVQKFKRAKDLQHHHLIKLGELGEHQGVAYITLEDFDGTTLRQMIQEYKAQGKPFDLKEASQIVTQVLEGVHYAHEQGVYLRALRPEYVLVNARWTGPRKQTFVAQTKVIGAGLWDLVPSATLAEDEFTRGEAQYMAPELKSFEPQATARCDVYSAGVIYYEMLTGTAPVGTFQHPRARRPDLPAHVNQVAELALAHSPDDRYQSARDFANDIQRMFQDNGLTDQPANRRSWVVPLALALAIAVVLLISVILFNVRPDPQLQAEAADSQDRARVLEAHVKPTGAEIKAILEQQPKNMMYIPAGPYLAGRLRAEGDYAGTPEPVVEERQVPAYLIDLFEYPNLADGAAAYNVTADKADELCKAQGKRLCSADEWEKACKGPQNFVYTYGDTWDSDFCGTGLDDVFKSGTRSGCRSGWGVYDMSGNFREWTGQAPNGNAKRRIVKGGVKDNPTRGTRCAYSTDEAAVYSDDTLSFRCCRDLDAPPPPPPAPPAAPPTTP